MFVSSGIRALDLRAMATDGASGAQGAKITEISPAVHGVQTFRAETTAQISTLRDSLERDREDMAALRTEMTARFDALMARLEPAENPSLRFGSFGSLPPPSDSPVARVRGTTPSSTDGSSLSMFMGNSASSGSKAPQSGPLPTPASYCAPPPHRLPSNQNQWVPLPQAVHVISSPSSPQPQRNPYPLPPQPNHTEFCQLSLGPTASPLTASNPSSSPLLSVVPAHREVSHSGPASALVDEHEKLSAILRAPRNIRKRRHGDMAYEGDVDWEISTNDQGFDSDNSIRARLKLDSSSSIGTEAESGGAAAVSAGLKAHAVGPVEKIKFKEILKRRGGLQDYLECRNQILALWGKDVSRILPLTDCWVTESACVDEPGRASLIRDIYAFLDLSGYINVGIAAEKDKAEPGSKHDYKILREKPFEEISGVSVADSEDGVSFIIGQVKNSKASTDAKNGITFNSENLTEGATKDNGHVGAVALELPDAKNPAECQTDYLENCSADVRFQSRLDNMDVSSSDPSGETLDGGAVPVVTPEIKHESQSIQSTPYDNLPNHNTLQCVPEVRKEIIVIGAGPAGLTAARHLKRQGFSVNVLEARSRIGGRVFTDRSSLSVAVDLGASIITGVEADWATERRPDPSSLVCAQLGLELTVLNSDCPLYDIETGQKVPAELDEALEAEFNSLLDDMVLLVAQKGERAARMSLEEGFEYALKRRRMAQSGSAKEKELHGSRDDGRTNIDVRVADKSCSKQELLSPLERRVMDWHFANLEYGCAAPLKEVSLPHWNQDDVYGGFGGAHCMIKGGYSTVVESLGEGLCIHLDHVVTDISYGAEDGELNNNQRNKVKVSTSNGSIFCGDAVLVTVPLGCLKAETIKFSPPLPQWKHSSITRLGFGILNKVVLEFPDVFWDDSVDYFGATAEETDLRGQCFMFWNIKSISKFYPLRLREAEKLILGTLMVRYITELLPLKSLQQGLDIVIHYRLLAFVSSSHLLHCSEGENLGIISIMQHLYDWQSTSYPPESVHLSALIHTWQVTTRDGIDFGAALTKILASVTMHFCSTARHSTIGVIGATLVMFLTSELVDELQCVKAFAFEKLEDKFH